MEKYADKTLTEFTAAIKTPEMPGGGAAAAMAGALGAALGCMVSNLTVGKEKYAGVEAEVSSLLRDLGATSDYLLRQVDEDARAFQPLAKYLAMPKGDPKREENMEAALRVACQVPTEVMYTSARAAEMLAVLAEKGFTGAVSDVGVGLELCRAAMRAARWNILVNARGMKDEVFSMTLRRECELVMQQYDPIIDGALAKVEERLK